MEDHKIFKIMTNNDTKKFIKYVQNNENDEYVGIDFEFYNNKIALWQIAFFYEKIVFIINPKILSKKHIKIIRRKILCSRKYIKILHGSESIDLPYIYELLNKNEKHFIKFIKYFVDTRFLCENIKKKYNLKCSLFDGLYSSNVITHKMYAKLQKTEKIIGPIHKINWKIQNMTYHQLFYAASDVIHLLHFYKKLLSIVPNPNLVIATTKLVMLNKNLNIVPLIHNKNSTHFNKKINDMMEIDYFKSTLNAFSSYMMSKIKNDKLEKIINYVNIKKEFDDQ
jgi:hypothetical protein